MNVPTSDEVVELWGAWLVVGLVAAFTFGYACARDNRAVMFIAVVAVAFCAFETAHLHRRDVAEVRRSARAASRLRGLP